MKCRGGLVNRMAGAASVDEHQERRTTTQKKMCDGDFLSHASGLEGPALSLDPGDWCNWITDGWGIPKVFKGAGRRHAGA